MSADRRLFRNVTWNLCGLGAPLLLAAVTIPWLITGLGKERFAVLALVWSVTGYFSLVDLGLGRALTKVVAEKLGANQEAEIAQHVRSGLAAMLLLGLAGALLVAGLAPWLTQRVLKIPEGLQDETCVAFWIMALSIPAVILHAGLRGVLEAHQRFDLTNAIRIPLALFQFASPLAVLLVTKHLGIIVTVLLAGRTLAALASLIVCWRIVPGLRSRALVEHHAVQQLLKFGGWMTVSNVIGPLLVSLDRFMIGALVSLSAVAYYVTPYEVITKLLIVASAMMGVWFPAFSASYGRDPVRVRQLFFRALTWLTVLVLPAILGAAIFAAPLLTRWVGTDFATHSSRVAQWLAVGVFINCLAQVPFALIQGAGRPDLTAKLHLVELPVYVLTLVLLINRLGIEGAAIAWTLRVAADALALHVLARRFL